MTALMTYGEVAQEMGVSVKTVRRYIGQRRLRCVRFSHKVRRVTRPEFERFIERSAR